MAKFRTLLHGVNDSGNAQPCGFYVTAFVEADSGNEAKSLAISLVQKSNKISDARFKTIDLGVEELHEIDDWPVDTSRPLTGFAFYDHPNEGRSKA
jgi:hypothetical protein